jgi:hypothetical protein
MLPRWVKQDFWRQAEPQNGRAKEKMVDEIITVVDNAVVVVASRSLYPQAHASREARVKVPSGLHPGTRL